VIRRIAVRLLGAPLAALVTGPAAFLLGGVIDVLAFAATSARERIRARAGGQ
jgi:hypothetical protein